MSDMQVILLGFFIPPAPGTGGFRGSTYGLVPMGRVNDSLNTAIDFLNSIGRQSIVINVVDYEDFIKDPALYINEIKQNSIDAYQLEHQDDSL